MHIGEARSFVEASGGALGPDPVRASRFLHCRRGRRSGAERKSALHGGGRCRPTTGILPRVASSPSRGGCARRRASRVKLFATAVLALERAGASSPGDRLALIHGWNTATLLVKNGNFEAGEIAAMRTFAETRSFDLAWYPGMSAWEANRFNRQAEPYLYRAAAALLGPERDSFLRITSSTSPRPPMTGLTSSASSNGSCYPNSSPCATRAGSLRRIRAIWWCC